MIKIAIFLIGSVTNVSLRSTTLPKVSRPYTYKIVALLTSRVQPRNKALNTNVEELLPVTNGRPSAMVARLTRPIIIRLVSHVRRSPIVHGRLHCFQYDCPPGTALLLKVSIVIIISSHYARRFMGSCNFVRTALILGLLGTRISPTFFRSLGLFDVRRNFASETARLFRCRTQTCFFVKVKRIFSEYFAHLQFAWSTDKGLRDFWRNFLRKTSIELNVATKRTEERNLLDHRVSCDFSKLIFIINESLLLLFTFRC